MIRFNYWLFFILCRSFDKVKYEHRMERLQETIQREKQEKYLEKQYGKLMRFLSKNQDIASAVQEVILSDVKLNYERKGIALQERFYRCVMALLRVSAQKEDDGLRELLVTQFVRDKKKGCGVLFNETAIALLHDAQQDSLWAAVVQHTCQHKYKYMRNFPDRFIERHLSEVRQESVSAPSHSTKIWSQVGWGGMFVSIGIVIASLVVAGPVAEAVGVIAFLSAIVLGFVGKISGDNYSADKKDYQMFQQFQGRVARIDGQNMQNLQRQPLNLDSFGERHENAPLLQGHGNRNVDGIVCDF